MILVVGVPVWTHRSCMIQSILNYDIHFEYDEHYTTKAITWKRKTERVEKLNSFHGKYIVRTNITEKDEETIWNYYNVIRTVETVFRVLKKRSGHQTCIPQKR